jgi:hypothetical protein
MKRMRFLKKGLLGICKEKIRYLEKDIWESVRIE